MRARLLPVLLLAASAQAAGDGGGVFGAPLELTVDVGRVGAPRVSLGLSVRWEDADLPRLPRRAARLALDPFGTAARALGEALSGAEVGVDRLHLRAGELLPVRLIVSPLAYLSERVSPFAAPGPAEEAGMALSRRYLNDEAAKEDLARELHRTAVDCAFAWAVPAGRGAPEEQKEQVVRDVREAGAAWADGLSGR